MARRDGTRANMRERTLSTSLLIALILLAVALGHAEPGRAQEAGDELPAEPVLRIETGLHVGKIRRIDTDAGNRFAVTASDDKTVRVWSKNEPASREVPGPRV